MKTILTKQELIAKIENDLKVIGIEGVSISYNPLGNTISALKPGFEDLEWNIEDKEIYNGLRFVECIVFRLWDREMHLIREEKIFRYRIDKCYKKRIAVTTVAKTESEAYSQLCREANAHQYDEELEASDSIYSTYTIMQIDEDEDIND